MSEKKHKPKKLEWNPAWGEEEMQEFTCDCCGEPFSPSNLPFEVQSENLFGEWESYFYHGDCL